MTNNISTENTNTENTNTENTENTNTENTENTNTENTENTNTNESANTALQKELHTEVISDKEIAKRKAIEEHEKYLADMYASISREGNTITFLDESWTVDDTDMELFEGMKDFSADIGHTGIKELDKQLQSLQDINKSNKLNQLKFGKILSEMREKGYYKKATATLKLPDSKFETFLEQYIGVPKRTAYHRIAQYVMCSDIHGEIDKRVMMFFTPAQIGVFETYKVSKELMQTVLNKLTSESEDVTRITPEHILETVENVKSAAIAMKNNDTLTAGEALAIADGTANTVNTDGTANTVNTDGNTVTTTTEPVPSEKPSDIKAGTKTDDILYFVSTDGKRGLKINIDDMDKVADIIKNAPAFFRGTDNGDLGIDLCRAENHAFIIAYTNNFSKVITFKCKW